MSELTHFNQAGEAHMVDIADKDQTHRIGIAEGWISMHPETFALVERGTLRKETFWRLHVLLPSWVRRRHRI